MPIVMLLVIFSTVLLCQFVPVEVQQVCYSISMSIRELMVASLPVIVFTLLLRSSLGLSGGATKMIATIIALVCCSSFCATFLSHYAGSAIYKFDWSIAMPPTGDGMAPLWSLKLPRFVSNGKAMIAGFAAGFALSKYRPHIAHAISPTIDKIIAVFFSAIVCSMPCFIAGFIMKLHHDGMMHSVITNYSAIFALIITTQALYISAVYFISSGCNLRQFLISIKNMIPAGISGFSTMSSAASIPLSIMGVENNTQNKEFARCVVPATVNIHMLGDCFAIPILAYAVMKSYGMPEPSVLGHLVFTIYFIITKFSGAAVPAGSIIIMIPILEEYFGFNDDMVSLITSLYILFDPVFTCANVMGNGALAKMIDTVLRSGTKLVPSNR